VQLDLDQLPGLVDPLPVGWHGGGQGAVGQMPARLAAAAPQLALAHPSALAGHRLTGQTHDGGGVVVGQAVEGRRPRVQVQPGQAHSGPGGQYPGVAEQAAALGPAGLLPPLHTLADGALPQPARVPHRGGRQPAQHQREHIEPGGVLLTNEPQRGQVPSGGLGTGIPRLSSRRPTGGENVNHAAHRRSPLRQALGGSARDTRPGAPQ
jgi:hypothetical protein